MVEGERARARARLYVRVPCALVATQITLISLTMKLVYNTPIDVYKAAGNDENKYCFR